MERAILVIVLIVALVGVVGLFSTYNFGPADAIPATGYASGSLTGNAVTSGNAAPNYDCSACAGYAPVCAKLNNRYITFKNACEAGCSGARVVRAFACERI